VATVWISDWEMECCGEPFAVSEYVEWPGKVVDRSDWLERLFRHTRVVVDFAYDGHLQDGEPALIKVCGVVERIEAVGSPVTRTPVDVYAVEHNIVEGGAVRQSINRAQRTPPFRQRNVVEFVGYLVHLA
jgi:hypothetical protein